MLRKNWVEMRKSSNGSCLICLMKSCKNLKEIWKMPLMVSGTRSKTLKLTKFSLYTKNLWYLLTLKRRSLTSDFRNPSELRSNSKHRLEFLRHATMKEEQSYNRLKVLLKSFDSKLDFINVKCYIKLIGNWRNDGELRCSSE